MNPTPFPTSPSPFPAPQACCDTNTQQPTTFATPLTAGTGSCCPPQSTSEEAFNQPFVIGSVATATGKIPRVSSTLTRKDILGAWKARWGIGRNNYKVMPGIYAIGEPSSDSPVLVTANYKLTFDMVRKELPGLDAWILILDTKGVNVWCAAGKGTFGTSELASRIQSVRLSSIVNHREVIVPQLGAPGIAAHMVKLLCGFKVVYGPVLAKDLIPFLNNGMKATPDMRRMPFGLLDRIVLTPVDFRPAMSKAIQVFGIMFLLNAIGVTGFNRLDVLAVTGAVFSGAVLTPTLLPWIPSRMFTIKGVIVGLIWTAILILSMQPGMLTSAAYLLLLPAISAYLAMNFTGASTYTSFSGVKKEMDLVVKPLFIISVLGGVLLLSDAIWRIL